MALFVYSNSLRTNYVIVMPRQLTTSYEMGVILNSRAVDSNKTSTDLDTILYPSIIPVYQTNLTVISTNNTITTDLNNNITDSTYGLTFNINNISASMPNNLYSSLLTDSTIQINDTNNTIFDSQYTPSSIWVNNSQNISVSNPSSFISM